MKLAQKKYLCKKIYQSYFFSLLIACGIYLCGCSSELPVFVNPKYPSINIRLGINGGTSPDKQALANHFAKIAYASGGFKDVNILGEKTKESDCDLVASINLTKLQYHESISVGTVITPTLLMSGGIFFLSIGGKEGKGGLSATYLGVVSILGSLIKLYTNVYSDKTDFSHTIDGTLIFKIKDIQTGKNIIDTVNVSHSIIYSQKNMDVDTIRSYCEEYVISKLCEKALDKIIELTFTKKF